jgi:hypothetical protein
MLCEALPIAGRYGSFAPASSAIEAAISSLASGHSDGVAACPVAVMIGAIHAEALVLSGTGHSRASPSFFPCAARVAEICSDKWVANVPTLINRESAIVPQLAER